MAGRRLPGTAVRVRRGRRRDLPRLRGLLGAELTTRLERVFRRILADLGTDVYVAEDGGGEIVGVVSVVYVRSLAQGGLAAVLDGARVRLEAGEGVLDGLVAFAEERARGRGCRRLAAWPEREDAALRATLLARGYRAADLLVAALPEDG